MIEEGSGKIMLFNASQTFYFRTFLQAAQFLGVPWKDIRDAFNDGAEVRGFCVDEKIPRSRKC